MKRLILTMGAIFALALASVGVAQGLTATNDGPLGDVTTLADLSTFRTAIDRTVAEQSELTAVIAAAKSVGAGSIASGADFTKARAVAIPGSPKHVWLAPSGTDNVCLFVPNEVGMSTSCGPFSTIGETGLVSVSKWDKAGTGLAVAVVPDGASAPKLIRSNGTSSALSLRGNAAVTKIASGEKITTGPATVPGPQTEAAGL